MGVWVLKPRNSSKSLGEEVVMYRGLWNLLPGGVVLKTLLAVLLAVGVFFLLMEVVFPYVAELMPYSDVSV
ncbi:hypothetical protein [Corynebacterium pseudodiphtheriticum]|uniref:hypothetical protein n=2 Tax=Corynebacteriaceae TaxID=1653 RepID=UPI001EF6E0CF|nr:hypothetical protein [Corynebacterium pseudodiphtheriticum]MCG7251852.1 hypothetical protein [Corynebacterium pseudodiphtheriticum]